MKNPPTSFTRAKASEPAADVEEQIRQRAYELYEQRGREDGRDVEDWLTAESEVKGKATAVAA